MDVLGRSTKIISMMKWIRARRLSIKNSLSLLGRAVKQVVDLVFLFFFIAFEPSVE